ncbi:MAG: ATP-grasp domain-containing protein [Armatimonadetes bacterium]|nr:ATP-grasp domain-containing protein [Armatimonadota bacterium]
MAIRKLLVANRGEIAVRVFHTCRKRGIRTVAVASDADLHAMHAEVADETVALGASEASESYLQISKIIDACRVTGADAVHPGYGFLSERAEFADALADAGILFLGPPASAMRKLGDKISAKQLAVESEVPITPGFFEAGAADDALEAAAHKIGFPVMLKASAGGGGRGMRAVFDPSKLREELKMASDEALKSFGDGQMMVEKLVLKPRHIEVQLMADQHGAVAALYERECSLQRRHQKVIEEAPSPVMTDELWHRMRAASIELAQRAGYQGAGTVEFMLDDDSGEFYFREVNARLQVEHPVTESITGLDLVGLQIDVAEGKHLVDVIPSEFLNGDRGAIRGHAIEARIVAEDPGRGFIPSIGKILAWHEPKGPGIRVDTGFGEGKEVSRFYDSMLSKAIATGSDRADATQILKGALEDFHVLGVSTNIEYLIDLIALPDFASANFDTKYLEREHSGWERSSEIPMVLGDLVGSASAGSPTVSGKTPHRGSAWNLGDSWRVLKT